jgi:superfamily II DNA or RNA helicase
MQAFKHQKEILEDPRKRLLLAWDTGTGKTYGAELLANKWSARCLIIVPKSQYEKWTFMEDSGHKVVTKEWFRDHLKEVAQDYKELNLNGIIIDEAHFFAGVTSKMTKALMKFNKFFNPEYMWLLTATPVLSTPWNVYTLSCHLGYPIDYAKFRKMFFYQIKMGNRYIWKELSRISHQGQYYTPKAMLHSILNKFTVWVDFEDVARDNDIEYDLSKQTKKVHFLAQTLEQQKKQFRLTQEGIALWTKKHTVQNGFYEDEYEELQYFEDPKLTHILSVVKKQPKLAIVCRYHRQMERYQKELEDRGHEVHIIKGGVKDIENYTRKLDVMDKCVVIIQANVSEGYELPSFPYVIFASLSFAYKDYKQMFGRFLRVNAITPTHVDILLMIDGVDIDVYKSVSNKQNFYLTK